MVNAKYKKFILAALFLFALLFVASQLMRIASYNKRLAREQAWPAWNAIKWDNAGIEEITRIIKEGADVNAVNWREETPLMYAASFNPNPDVLRLSVIPDSFF